MLTRFVEITKDNDADRLTAINLANSDESFINMMRESNPLDEKSTGHLQNDLFTEKKLRVMYQQFGYDGWKDFKEKTAVYNHRVTSIEYLDQTQDVGTITVDFEERWNSHHTFAIDAGIFVKNSMLEDYFFSTTSNGRGSRVETLPGGENLGEITDLNYFQEKVFRGLRIPASYMRSADKGGSQANDGKVGVAYIEELRFANFVMRLQNKIEQIFDAEFKLYLKASKINIDQNLFIIKLPEPSNFALYKQAAVDAELINTFNSVEQIDYVSKRFALRRYLKWTEDDEQQNEVMLRQERNIPEGGYGDDLTDIRMMYDPKWKDNRPDIKVPEDFENSSADEDGGGDEGEAPPEEGKDEAGGDTGGGEDKGKEEKSDDTPPDLGAEEKPAKDESKPPKL
jgi:hypothetical protein